MPTGFTANIGDKEDYTVKEYILNCARAFGYLGSLRDSYGEIPEKLEYDTYHKDALEEVKEKIKLYINLNREDADIKCEEEYQIELESHNSYINKKLKLSQKYNEFLHQLVKWNVPSSEHQELKKFCIEQINTSIEYDCCTNYSINPIKLDTESWLENKNLWRYLKDGY